MVILDWIIMTLYAATVLGTLLTVLMDNRQPAKTMAWVLVLVFIPVVGVVFYFFFGRNVRKERYISRQSMDQLTKRSMLEFAGQEGLELPAKYEPLIRLFTRMNWALPFRNNEIGIITDGGDFVVSLLRDIAKAESHIHLETYIICDDPVGRLVSDALMAKARAGVEVRLIYDDVGCWHTPGAFFERMRSAGVEVHAFMPVKFPAFTSKVNYRNHRKLCVVDGRTGYIGGMNIALRYVKGDANGPWRDTHLRVCGGSVYGIQRAFLVDWYFVDRTLISNRRYYPEAARPISNGCIVQIVTSSPVSPWSEIMQGYVRVLSEARGYVYMCTPYFMPTEPVVSAMRMATLAGVDVRLMIPMRSDSRMAEAAGRSFVAEAAEAGVKVYCYSAGFNHSKLLVSDDAMFSCGSTNVDFRSFDNNFEANAFVYDREAALRMKRVFMADLERCVPYEDCLHAAGRGYWRRLGASVMRLLSPLL